jgi:hypothetical protein
VQYEGRGRTSAVRRKGRNESSTKQGGEREQCVGRRGISAVRRKGGNESSTKEGEGRVQ